MRVVVNYRKGQKHWIKGSISEEYFGRTTYLQPTVTWKALNCFPWLPGGHHEAQMNFFLQRDKKLSEEPTKVRET